jgi:hypothetical protein
LWFAWLCLVRVLFDGTFARKLWQTYEADRGGLPPPASAIPSPRAVTAELPPPPPAEPALQLLSLLQREGRLIDFLEQDITSFSDADIGAAARVVHDGCQKALHTHVKISPLREEDEGTRVTIADGFEPAVVKLTGEVRGSAPYRGVLRHRGWRASELTLPRAVKGYDPMILAPAEVEL